MRQFFFYKVGFTFKRDRVSESFVKEYFTIIDHQSFMLHSMLKVGVNSLQHHTAVSKQTSLNLVSQERKSF